MLIFALGTNFSRQIHWIFIKRPIRYSFRFSIRRNIRKLVNNHRLCSEYDFVRLQEGKSDENVVEEEEEEEEEQAGTKKPHIHEHHKTEGEFIDKKKNSGEWGREKVTTAQPKKSREEMEELLGSGENGTDFRNETVTTPRYREVDSRRAIKCSRRPSKRGGTSFSGGVTVRFILTRKKNWALVISQPILPNIPTFLSSNQ